MFFNSKAKLFSNYATRSAGIRIYMEFIFCEVKLTLSLFTGNGKGGRSRLSFIELPCSPFSSLYRVRRGES